MKQITTVTNNKPDFEKRLSKPLPVMPTQTSLHVSLDDSFHHHFNKLLGNWLIDLNIPVRPWFDVLHTITIDLLSKAFSKDDTENKEIYLQTISTNTPIESKFLVNVYHGAVVHEDGYATHFPIGGTIRLYGVNDEMLLQSLSILVQTLVYLVNSLFLETFIMRDSRVNLTSSTTTKITTTTTAAAAAAATAHKSTHSLQQPHEKTPKHMFGWLRKLATPPKATVVVSEGLKRGFSLIKKQQPEKDPDQDKAHRYVHLRRQIDKALVSSSPDCYFPYPSLLNKLAAEENKLLEYKRVTLLQTSKQFETITQKRPSLKRKSSSFLRKLSSTPSFINEIIDVQLPQSVMAYSSIRNDSLRADSKKGLEHLLLDTTSFESFRRHQNIAVGFTCYPIGCPDRPCLGPVMIQMDYFRYQAPQNTETLFPRIDQSLGSIIRHWHNQSQSTCQQHIDEQAQFIPGLLVESPAPVIETTHVVQTRSSESSLLTPFFAKPSGSSSSASSRHCSKFHGCQQPLIDHTLSFTHGTGRVLVYTSVESLCTRANKDKLMTCISCSVCDATTTYTALSDQAASYSFAKYLELLFYSKKLASLDAFCEHHGAKSALVRTFLYNGITFKFMYEDATFYDLQLPRFQIAPQHQHHQIKITFSEPRMSVLTEWKEKAKEDIDLFFATVPSNNNNNRLSADHAALVTVLMETSVNELNDFRRHFAIQTESILAYLDCKQEEEWHHQLDYIASKDIHCFPGSSVLVRETEPTSIIAYTLSSNEYFQELLRDDEDAQTISVPSLASSSDNDEQKTLSPPPPSQLIDGYYSSIERKYVSPSTGATTETASFRTMITEVVKSSVSESGLVKSNSKRLDDFKERWTRKQEESKLEHSDGDLKRKLTERVLRPLHTVQQQEETKEIKLTSYFYEEGISSKTKKTISPHINHKFVHGDIEFTCIVYYAKEFELLRRQCDIHQLVIESLSRCQTWTASGGKSKSSFYKTQDDRFVIKEMVNAWNLAEKDAFLKFAPKYFDHLKKSANEPSILAKVFGFFTIRMKSITDKKTILNLDVMVMEHLFYNQTIIKRFDFKGIQDRHVEEYRKQQDDCTLWDGDWLDEYRTKLPVYEESKAIMEMAIQNDTLFLSKCNIMDYSLLVGVNQKTREMTIGIVDFIGAYTWYKRIESRSKSTLQPRKEVTVLPPEQYKLRFCREVCDYFIPVPGKFDLVEPSKTLPSLLI